MSITYDRFPPSQYVAKPDENKHMFWKLTIYYLFIRIHFNLLIQVHLA